MPFKARIRLTKQLLRESLIATQVGLHRGDADLHRHDADLHRLNVNLHRLDVNLHRLDVSQHRPNVSRHRADVSRHRADVSQHRADVASSTKPDSPFQLVNSIAAQFLAQKRQIRACHFVEERLRRPERAAVVGSGVDQNVCRAALS